MPFWFEDERQVYLVGLQSFVRGEWPYFGADVVWTGAQLPGALLGWLIRLPLAIWSAPESPIVFLNVLSFSALGLLAWYFSRRLPSVPTWLIWLSLLTLPWTLNFSTHVVNPSVRARRRRDLLCRLLRGDAGVDAPDRAVGPGVVDDGRRSAGDGAAPHVVGTARSLRRRRNGLTCPRCGRRPRPRRGPCPCRRGVRGRSCDPGQPAGAHHSEVRLGRRRR